MTRTRPIITVALFALAALAAPAAAQEGHFELKVCFVDKHVFDAGPFAPVSNHFGVMDVDTSCGSRQGVLVATDPARGKVPAGTFARAAVDAPPGTEFRAIRWAGVQRRRDCRWEIGFYARRWNPAGALESLSLAGANANRTCPKRDKPQKKTFRRQNWIGRGARLGVQLVCVGKPGKRYCARNYRNYFDLRGASVTVADVAPPQIHRLLPEGLASPGWVRGPQPVTFEASDNIGIAQQQLLAQGVERDSVTPACDPSLLQGRCSAAPRSLRVNTSDLGGDGQHPFEVLVRDAAGLESRASGVANVDNTPPAPVPVAVDGGEGWRRTNAFTVRWANPPEAFAPITAAHYELRSAGSGSAGEAQRRGQEGIDRLESLSVPGNGEFELRVWREDAAGNQNSQLASAPVRLRLDNEVPTAAFEEQAAADPTRVAVAVQDRVSGLAGGEIELRRQGTNSWHTLPTGREGSHLVARVDDSAFPAGAYDLRSRAFDQAGNEVTTDRRASGAAATVTLPLRVRSRLRAGFPRRKAVRRIVRRGGKRRAVRRRVTVLKGSRRVRQGRRVRISGRLVDANGSPMAGQLLFVSARSAVEPERLVGLAATDARGRYRYSLRAGSSQVIRITFIGGALIQPAQRELTLRVPARSTIRVSRRTVANGRRTVFSGRLRSLPAPAGGKLVELQVRLPGRWQTFRTTRADGAGRWRVPYRFVGTRGSARYLFRARLPAEAGYPFARGSSRRIAVRVRGR